MVQKQPAKESANRAPMMGVRLEVPLKLLRVLVDSTRGMCSSWVKYETIFALNPAAANLSQISFPSHPTLGRVKVPLGDCRSTRSWQSFSHWTTSILLPKQSPCSSFELCLVETKCFRLTKILLQSSHSFPVDPFYPFSLNESSSPSMNGIVFMPPCLRFFSLPSSAIAARIIARPPLLALFQISEWDGALRVQ